MAPTAPPSLVAHLSSVTLMGDCKSEKQGGKRKCRKTNSTNKTLTLTLRRVCGNKTQVYSSFLVAPPVQPRLNMAIVQLNTGDENLQGWR